MVVGPWIDGYFVQEVIDSLPNKKIDVKFIVRIDGLEEIDAKTLSALNLAQKNIDNYEAKTLPKLHAKVILIDNETFYLGSTNWYWYSLNESLELTIIGQTSAIPGLIHEIQDYWDNGHFISNKEISKHEDVKPIKEDIDEYARKVLESDPKAFIIGKK
jgi:phosphatidylserine/phosphatidylglycerophosphate/cardiolipin synthase-like enzyme